MYNTILHTQGAPNHPNNRETAPGLLIAQPAAPSCLHPNPPPIAWSKVSFEISIADIQ